MFPQMKKHTLFTLIAGLMVFTGTLSPVQAQYTPDTSLTYTDFLRQCQQFVQEKPNQVWVVNFWASTNSRDRYALSGLKRVYQTFQYKPVRFISISVDKNRQAWLSAVERARLPWEQMFLPNLQDYNFLRKAFKHNSTPAIYVVHTTGQIQRVLDAEELQFELEQITRTLPNGPYQPDSPLDEYAFENENDPYSIPTPSPTPQPAPAPASGDWLYHTVRKGDTLFSLYRQYGVKPDVIRSINGLPDNTIKIGQRLKIKRQ